MSDLGLREVLDPGEGRVAGLGRVGELGLNKAFEQTWDASVECRVQSLEVGDVESMRQDKPV